ncbi:hypothetical protein HRbin35_00206 [bacterium HR35]|nr:hypothetical protein HRbin35_00206 [bacterium HR35]
MRKLIIVLSLFFIFEIVFAQSLSVPDPEINQIFLKLMSFVYKLNYFDQKISLAKMEITNPTSKSKFRPASFLELRWNLIFREPLTKSEQTDPDYILPYSWKIALYNFEISNQPLKEDILPFDLRGRYNYRFEIPFNFTPSNKYLWIIELRNNFSNRVLKRAESQTFQIIPFETSQIKLESYNGYLLKLPSKTFDDFEFILITSNQIYFLKAENINLNNFINTFVKVKGRKMPTLNRDLSFIEVVSITPYR